MSPIASHGEVTVYKLNTEKGDYIAKCFPKDAEHVEEECFITEFLQENGIGTARFQKNLSGTYVGQAETYVYTIQEFIEGQIFPLGAAPMVFG